MIFQRRYAVLTLCSILFILSIFTLASSVENLNHIAEEEIVVVQVPSENVVPFDQVFLESASHPYNIECPRNYCLREIDANGAAHCEFTSPYLAGGLFESVKEVVYVPSGKSTKKVTNRYLGATYYWGGVTYVADISLDWGETCRKVEALCTGADAQIEIIKRTNWFANLFTSSVIGCSNFNPDIPSNDDGVQWNYACVRP